MVKLLFRILILFSFSLTALAQAKEIKIMTFNTMLVCVGPGCILANSPKVEERKREIGEYIASQDLDLVFLQEVFQDSQFNTVLKFSKMPYSYYVGADTGLAILSRYPLSDTKFVPYRWQAASFRDCKRLFVGKKLGFASAIATLDDGSKISIASTHLLPRYDDMPGFALPADEHTPQRKANILELREELYKLPKEFPIILAGDFNMNQKSEENAFFSRVIDLENVLKKKTPNNLWANLCTYCDANPYVIEQGNRGEGVIDYIWISKNSFSISDVKINKDTDRFSDHRAVVATLRIVTPVNYYNPLPVSNEEVEKLKIYFEKVSINPLCWLAPSIGWTERGTTLQFLEKVSKGPLIRLN